MGKSSLRVQTMCQLQQLGTVCTAIDLTKIGSKNLTPDQWYAGVVRSLTIGFNLSDKFNLQLFNFIVVENTQQPNHYVLIDLISNIGTLETTTLLLKIVLLSRKVKPDLEKRFSILFNHYESQALNDIRWFINSLENLNVALVVNFGTVNISWHS